LGVVSYLQKNGEAIAYIGYYYYYNNRELLSAAPIKNSEGVYITPSAKTIGDGSYHPLVHKVSMNIWNNPSVLKDVVPWLRFGYNHPELVNATGMVPIRGDSVKEMLRRLSEATEGQKPKASSSTCRSDLIAVYTAAMVLVVTLL
jgi:ABC-type phosphate transport system substrate-binding protein